MSVKNVVSINKKAYPKTNMEYALAYAELGWFVFPVWNAKDGKCLCKRLCSSPAKHPVAHLVPRGQDDATTDPDLIKKWWSIMPAAGIAVFLQPSGLFALDCDPRNGGLESFDEMEAKHGKITSDVMQLTQSGGWHMLFKLAKDANITLPGKFGAGLDCKRQGYIILPPSAGIVGKYEWEASSDPLDGCIPSPLPDFFGDYAHKTESLADTIPGTRHITEQQVEELTEALTYIPADERDTWLKIGMALFSVGQVGFSLWDNWAQKSSKYNPVDQMRVWRSFKPGALNYESVFFIAAEHGFVNTIQPLLPPAVPLESVAVIVPPVKHKSTTPAYLLNPPGILGVIVDWINATSRKSQPQFDVQAAIAFCSTVMGRRYCTDQNNFPSLYLLNVGKSASGKEHAKWAVEQMFVSCKLDHLIGPSGYTSSAGVVSTLHAQPVHIAIIDEFGRMLEAASVKGNSMAQGTLTSLMEAWGRCAGQIRPPGRSTFGLSEKEIQKMESRTVYNPAITLMGMSTPETFFDAIGTAAARDGFLNRFLIVETDIGRQTGSAAKALPVPQSVIDWATAASVFDGLINPTNPSASVTPKIIPIRDEAAALFAAYDAECISLMDYHDEAGLSEMFGRHNEQAMRLALIVAVADGWRAINEDHAKWAISYIRHYGMRVIERIRDCVSDSEFGAVSQQVLGLIKQNNGLTERDLAKKSRKFAALDKRGKIQVLDNLLFIGDISRCEVTGCNGKKSLKWFAIKQEETK